MGLAERRIIRDFEENDLPGLKSQVEEAAGFPVAIEVHWDNLAPAGETHLFKQGWTQVYFEPLITALKSVTRDDMGREALKDGLERVIIQNTNGIHDFDRWASFEKKVLTLDHDPIANIHEPGPRAAKLTEVLEAGL